jgi:HEAT repeat protein
MNFSTEDVRAKQDALDDIKVEFEALMTYDSGSERAALSPLDRATIRAIGNRKERLDLEARFITALLTNCSAVAREYICSKLALIGSEACVVVLAEYLSDPQVSTSARNTLEKIPVSAAAKALRKAAGKLTGVEQLGAIVSLGSRRDPESVALLTNLSKSTDTRIASASACALGQIGTVKAAKALREFVSAAPEPCRMAAADAGLVCAERLLAEGHTAEARTMYQALSGPMLQAHIQQAAARGLRSMRDAKDSRDARASMIDSKRGTGPL